MAARFDVDFIPVDEHRRTRLGRPLDDVELPADSERRLELERRRSRIAGVWRGRRIAAGDAEMPERRVWTNIAVGADRGHMPVERSLRADSRRGVRLVAPRIDLQRGEQPRARDLQLISGRARLELPLELDVRLAAAGIDLIVRRIRKRRRRKQLL